MRASLAACAVCGALRAVSALTVGRRWCAPRQRRRFGSAAAAAEGGGGGEVPPPSLEVGEGAAWKAAAPDVAGASPLGEGSAWTAAAPDVADGDWRPDEDDLILEADDAAVWCEERREYAACYAEGLAPRALRNVYKRSFTAAAPGKYGPESVMYLHAFDGSFPPLGALAYPRNASRACDGVRLRMVGDLLDAVAYLHDRGLPHLRLDANAVRAGADEFGAPCLKLVGAGAGPLLVATKRPFALPEAWPYDAARRKRGDFNIPSARASSDRMY